MSSDDGRTTTSDIEPISEKGTQSQIVDMERNPSTIRAPRCSTKFKEYIGDATLGFADGLTVPFALTAGLSQLGSLNLVVVAGLAELTSGAISMGSGAFLKAVSDNEQYSAEIERELTRIYKTPGDVIGETIAILVRYGVSQQESAVMIQALRSDARNWSKFVTDITFKIEERNKVHALISALVMFVSYFVGGIIPMVPYFVMPNVTGAFHVSIGIAAAVLISFGFFKSKYIVGTYLAAIIGAVLTVTVGGIAMGFSFGIAKGINLAKPANTC